MNWKKKNDVQEVQIKHASAKVLALLIRIIFVYCKLKKMSRQNVPSGTISKKFLKISFGKDLKQVLYMCRI